MIKVNMYELGYRLCITNAIKTYGHDDSLPFMADWHLEDLQTDSVLMSGTAHDDGWGGYICLYSNNRELEETLDKQMRELFSFTPKNVKETFSCVYGLDEIIGYLAVEYIYGHKNRTFTTKAILRRLAL